MDVSDKSSSTAPPLLTVRQTDWKQPLTVSHVPNVNARDDLRNDGQPVVAVNRLEALTHCILNILLIAYLIAVIEPERQEAERVLQALQMSSRWHTQPYLFRCQHNGSDESIHSRQEILDHLRMRLGLLR